MTTYTEWAVRTKLSDGTYGYHLNHIINWGTRFEQKAVPYSREQALSDIEHTTRYSGYPEAVVVSREVTKTETEWVTDRCGARLYFNGSSYTCSLDINHEDEAHYNGEYRTTWKTTP
jgi:hypothetical protein